MNSSDQGIGIQSSASFAVNGNMNIRNVSSQSSFELSSMLAAWVDNRDSSDHGLNISHDVSFNVDSSKNRGYDDLKWSDRELKSMESCALKRGYQAQARTSLAEQHCIGNDLEKTAPEMYSHESVKRHLDACTEPFQAKIQRFVISFSFITDRD
jgi:hypothetical protein